MSKEFEEKPEDKQKNNGIEAGQEPVRKKRKKKNKTLRIMGLLCLSLFLILVLLLVSKPGRELLYGIMGDYLVSNMKTGDAGEHGKETYAGLTHTANPTARKEDYVTNFLIMGIEEIDGGERTDSMIIASINTKEDKVKLTSLMRDMYVEIPGHKGNKLNAAFSMGGAQLLVDTIELNFNIYVDAYVFVNFDSFEQIVDRLGGVEIELGEKEAAYLNRTNYISKKEYRNVKPGSQILNGNQALGYCRVRKVETLGGATSDYGRTLRQRRVLKAIFEKYKSKNIVELIRIMDDCLQYVGTNLTTEQMKKALSDLAENKIMTMDSERIPVNGAFTEEKSYNGVGWVLLPDFEKNIEAIHTFIFFNPDEETDLSAGESGQ